MTRGEKYIALALIIVAIAGWALWLALRLWSMLGQIAGAP